MWRTANGSYAIAIAHDERVTASNFFLTGAVTLGRGGTNDLELGDEYVSTRHARFVPHNGQWYVEDLGSTNGTYVAGARISRPTPVGAKSTIRIGRTVLELRK